MAAQELHYFKFVTELIDSGIWAKMSPAARALYPVLLRFSDRNFKPVFPGSTRLLELTGFKQKSSLRKARQELQDLGLVFIQEGTGRKNSVYYFRFPWTEQPAHRSTPQRAPHAPPWETEWASAGVHDNAPYNQIHISINNHVQNKDPLFQSPGASGSEQEMDVQAPHENLEKILYRDHASCERNWIEILNFLSGKISPASFEMIRTSFRDERDGMLILSDQLPDYLKALLRTLRRNLFFEPDEVLSSATRRFYE